MYDGLGNVCQRLDSAGNVLGTEMWDSYGQGYGLVSGEPFGYGGEWGYYTDTETGLTLLGLRYYDAGRGRFLTRDPWFETSDNLYRYTENYPANHHDPMEKKMARFYMWFLFLWLCLFSIFGKASLGALGITYSTPPTSLLKNHRLVFEIGDGWKLIKVITSDTNDKDHLLKITKEGQIQDYTCWDTNGLELTLTKGKLLQRITLFIVNRWYQEIDDNTGQSPPSERLLDWKGS